MVGLVDTLIDAIKQKISLKILYQGYIRDVSPYLLAESQKGSLVLHCFQFGGDSSQGPITVETGSWRFLYLDKLEFLSSALDPNCWYPQKLAKAEGEYRPPPFIARVIAIHTPRE